jgi:two-component system, NtrC family, sensor kinase
MNAPNPGQRTGAPASALASELAALRGRVADLQTACEKAQLSEAAMRLAIAGLRRELNAPLSVLVLRVDLLLQEAAEHELPLNVVKDLAVLQRHLERLCRVEEVAAAAAEPDRGGLFDLNAIIRATIALVADRFEQRGIRVHTTLDGRLPPIAGNPIALGQTVMGLLTNASGTVPAGGAVWVETACTNDRPAGMRLVVRDDGPVMPDAVRANPGEPRPMTEPEGTGLGLSIIRDIVESHGGTVELCSRAGEGTTRIILLPGRNGKGTVQS